MAANSPITRILPFLLLTSLQVHLTVGKGVIDIHFLSYSDDCDELGSLGTCDPMFTFCLTRPGYPSTIHRSECFYEATSQSGSYSNTNSIKFEGKTRMNGLANPWIVPFDTLAEPTVKLVWRVQDADPVGSDHLVTHQIELAQRVWPNQGVAQYQKYTSQKSDHVLRFQARLYCVEDTYGPLCEVYCPPPGPQDRYYCDTDTGQRVCIEGWQGDECNTNVDECELGRCVHGKCTDTIGSYHCGDCDQGYSGQDCAIPDDSCETNPCRGRGICLVSPTTTTTATATIHPYRCVCFYPYGGDHCEDILTTTTTTSITIPSSTTTTATIQRNSTRNPVGQASRANSAGFPFWVVVVVAIGLVIVIGAVLICVVCRRRKKLVQRKDSRLPLSTAVKNDRGILTFDNNAYSSSPWDSTAETWSGGSRESLPPLPSAPPLMTTPSFQADKGAGLHKHEMDDDGYLMAKNMTNILRDATDGLTASGRRAKSNEYSNLHKPNEDGATPQASSSDYQDEEHYHDLDETVMALKNASNGNKFAPLPQMEEKDGIYSDVPRNVPSQRRDNSNHYDVVQLRPRSRDLPKLPSNVPEATHPISPRLEPQPSPGPRFPPIPLDNRPLVRTDPFAHPLEDDDYQSPDLDIPTQDYHTPRNSKKDGHEIRPVGEEGGYELPTGNGFHRGNPSRQSGEYQEADVVSPPSPSPLPKLYNNLTSDPYNNHKLAFQPSPPSIDLDDDLEDSHEPVQSESHPRPLSFHSGKTEKAEEEKRSKKGLAADGFLNPLFGGDGPRTLDDGDGPSRLGTVSQPLSFRYGQTSQEKCDGEGDDDTKGDVDDDKRCDGDDDKRDERVESRLNNTGFVNPIFQSSGTPADVTPSPSTKGSRDHTHTPDVTGTNDVMAKDDASKLQPSPSCVPLYMENFGFGNMEL